MTDKKQTMMTSKVIYNKTLYEQVYDPERNHSYYLGWDKQKQETIPMEYIEDINITYLPIQDDLLQKQAVILPTAAIDYKNQEELELEIECFIQTWLDISKEHLQKAVWYTLLTRIMDKINTIPYLRALGDYGTGKTRYLDVIGGLCYKPMFVGGSVRSAPIYRVIDLWHGTAIFDEFTLKKSDESEDIIQILNNGYQRGKPVLRCKDGNYDQVIAFDPFGSKVISSRSRFYDKALESRCITEIMTTTGRNDVPIDLTQSFYKQRQELQNKLLMYRFKNWDEINTDETITIDFGNILPRIKQSLAPFTVLFLHDETKMKSFKGYMKEYNNKIIEENSTSFDGQIINAYLNLLEQHTAQQSLEEDYHNPSFTSTDIKNYLVEFEGWKEEKINSKVIGKHLNSLGFETTPTKVSGKTKRIIKICDEKLDQLRRKYEVTLVTSVSSVTDEVKNKKIGEYDV